MTFILPRHMKHDLLGSCLKFSMKVLAPLRRIFGLGHMSWPPKTPSNEIAPVSDQRTVIKRKYKNIFNEKLDNSV